MKRQIGLVIGFVCFALVSAGSFAVGQEVKDFTGSEVSADTLIGVLTPKFGAPRGLSLVPPKCKHFYATRGIALVPKPVANIAAISVEFETNSAQLSPDAKKNLDALGQALGSVALKPCCFEIQGFTDSVGSDEYNEKLSHRRAQAVIAYLNRRASIESDRMMAKGLGKSQPIASNDTEEGRAKNRRVQIVNLGYGS
jgi:outer membrane protein OmpA-like peptidoglycan-associated protein